MVDTAIFLGAGASKAEGAPLQGELFRVEDDVNPERVRCVDEDKEFLFRRG